MRRVGRKHEHLLLRVGPRKRKRKRRRRSRLSDSPLPTKNHDLSINFDGHPRSIFPSVSAYQFHALLSPAAAPDETRARETSSQSLSTTAADSARARDSTDNPRAPARHDSRSNRAPVHPARATTPDTFPFRAQPSLPEWSPA